MNERLPDTDLLTRQNIAVLVITLLLLGGGGLYLVGGDGQEDLETIRIAHYGSSMSSPHYTGVEEGFYREAGFNVELVDITDSAMLPELLNGSLDVGIGNAVAITNWRSRDLPIRAVATNTRFPPSSDGGAYFVARNGSNIQTAEDIRGKDVCIQFRGGADHLWLTMWANEHNMTPGEDFNITVLPGGMDYSTGLASGAVDACYLINAHSIYTQMVQDGIAYRFDRMSHPEWIGTYVLVRTSWVQGQPEKLQRFLRAYVKAAQYARNNPQERIQNVAKYSRFSEQTLQDTTIPSIPEDLSVPLPIFQEVAGAMVDNGFIEQLPDMSVVVHNDIIQKLQSADETSSTE